MSPIAWAAEGTAAVLFLLLLRARLRARRGRVLAERDGPFGRVVVREVGGARELWLVRGRRAGLQGRVPTAEPLRSGIPYTDGFHLYPPGPGATALFVGAGAGIGPRQMLAFDPDVRVTVVERDPAVLEIAAEHFGLRAGPRLTLEVADGRAFLERESAWDRIIIDAFGPGDYPSSLATVELFRLCRARLRAQGVLIVNLAGRLLGSRLPSVLAGMVAAFGASGTRAFGVPRVHKGAPYDPRRRGNTLAFGFHGAPPAPAPPDPRFPHLAAIAACPISIPSAAPLHDGEVAPNLPIE